MREFIQQVAQDGAMKVDVAIAGAAFSSPIWLPHFDTIVHVLLGLGAVALIVSRVAIMWLQFRRSGKKAD